MNITNEQIEAAKSGQAVRINADDTSLVLIRSDLLENLQSGLPPEIITRIVDDTMADYDAGDSVLDSYGKHR